MYTNKIRFELTKNLINRLFGERQHSDQLIPAAAKGLIANVATIDSQSKHLFVHFQ